MTSIFDERNVEHLRVYIASAARFKDFNASEVERQALTAVRYYKGDASLRAEMTAGQLLEQRWYESLAAGSPDYDVYDDDFFVGDIWACWVVYSRKYLWTFKKSDEDYFPDVASAADLGCGIGYTTAALKELFPAATVIGTQLAGTFQAAVAAELGMTRGFSVQPAISENTDLIFASEYFEHFQRPIEHLLDVLRIGTPKYLIVANSFGSRSIGHFNTYLDERRTHIEELEVLHDVQISNTAIGRDFNAVLRNSGYEQLKTGFWNNRPTVWKKQVAA